MYITIATMKFMMCPVVASSKKHSSALVDFLASFNQHEVILTLGLNF